MTDYDYSGDDRVTLSDEKSGNAANGAGYDLTINRQADWPGTNANPNQLRAHPDKMKAVADTIDEMIRTLENSNAIGDVTTVAGRAQYGPPTWQAANFLRDATGDVSKVVTNYSTQLLTNLRQASASIRSAMAQHKSGEDSNKTMSNQQQGAIDSSAGY